MSHAVAHLAVANRILQAYPGLVRNTEAFYLGSIAPDAIESKPGCSRSDKKRVHLRDGIKDAQWLTDEKMCLFKSRIRQFADEHISGASVGQRDFNMGYLVHLLTDEWNHRTIRQTLLALANARKVADPEEASLHWMTNDLDALDSYLLSSNREIAEVLELLLRRGAQYALAGYIEKEYIEGSIQWWRNSYLPSIGQREAKYISEADMEDFVSLAAGEIVKELKALL